MSLITKRETVFSTSWFKIEAKTFDSSKEPYYAVTTLDYVSVLAVNDQHQAIFVQQYRPVVEMQTLELPSGHVEKEETPEEAARHELLDETGYEAENMEYLGTLMPDTGRLGNKMWCYFAPNVIKKPETPKEKGIRTIECPINEISSWIKHGKLKHALHIAVILLGIQKGKIKI